MLINFVWLEGHPVDHLQISTKVKSSAYRVALFGSLRSFSRTKLSASRCPKRKKHSCLTNIAHLHLTIMVKPFCKKTRKKKEGITNDVFCRDIWRNVSLRQGSQTSFQPRGLSMTHFGGARLVLCDYVTKTKGPSCRKWKMKRAQDARQTAQVLSRVPAGADSGEHRVLENTLNYWVSLSPSLILWSSSLGFFWRNSS